MVAKFKICDGCKKPRRIWKNSGGLKFCQQCWSAQNPQPIPTGKQKKIAPRSPKRAKEETEYTKERRKFLLERPMCEAHLPGICTQHSTDVHHTYSGKDRSQYFLVTSTWLSVCRMCHDWIHENSRSAREMGLLK
jgi:hypothetical protein